MFLLVNRDTHVGQRGQIRRVEGQEPVGVDLGFGKVHARTVVPRLGAKVKGFRLKFYENTLQKYVTFRSQHINHGFSSN